MMAQQANALTISSHPSSVKQSKRRRSPGPRPPARFTGAVSLLRCGDARHRRHTVLLIPSLYGATGPKGSLPSARFAGEVHAQCHDPVLETRHCEQLVLFRGQDNAEVT